MLTRKGGGSHTGMSRLARRASRLAMAIAVAAEIAVMLPLDVLLPVSASNLTGCTSLTLTANVPTPLYAGQRFLESTGTQCQARVHFAIKQTGSNPTHESPSGWGQTYDLAKLLPAAWWQPTKGFALGTYHYVAKMRVVGEAAVVVSPVLSFTVVAPLDTANPAGNDDSLNTVLNNACEQAADTADCESTSVTVLDEARAGEDIPPLTLPANFWSLPYNEQSLIVVNEERIPRNLAPFLGITAPLDTDALAGAVDDQDPADAQSKIGGWASNWTSGNANVLVDDFGYMYDDGINPPSGNADCDKITDRGCWGHRQNILIDWSKPPLSYPPVGPLKMGAACLAQSNSYLEGWADSCAEIFTNDPHSGAYIYTWAEAVADGA
jgi:hypothetical protein